MRLKAASRASCMGCAAAAQRVSAGVQDACARLPPLAWPLQATGRIHAGSARASAAPGRHPPTWVRKNLKQHARGHRELNLHMDVAHVTIGIGYLQGEVQAHA